jgi:hypothetical protein
MGDDASTGDEFCADAEAALDPFSVRLSLEAYDE